MTLFKWSQTALTNATADSSINLREGQAPSTLNDSVRALMAAVAKWRDDISGNIATAGSSTAYTVATSQGYTALTDGMYIRARAHATNGRSATLNVDGLGAKPIASVYGTALRPGFLVSGGVYGFTYDDTDDKWIVEGSLGSDVLVGEIKAYGATSAPAGWVRCNGRTIGNASSGGTERANADTEDLFTFLWTNYGDTICAVSSGRGASAAADFAANKNIALPDLRGRAMFGLDTMGNSAAGRLAAATIDQTTNGASGGADTVTLVTGNLPAHAHTFSDTATSGNQSANHTHDVTVKVNKISWDAGTQSALFLSSNNLGVTTDIATGNVSATHNHTVSVSGTTSSVGSGTAIDKLPPCFLTTFIIKL